MAEIEDHELFRLRGADKLLGELMNTPKHKKVVQAAVHDYHPEYSPEPELVTKEDTQKLIEAALEKQASNVKRENLEKAFQDRINHYRLSEKNPEGLTEEGIQKVLGVMKERTIPDFDAGVAIFEKLYPKPKEPPSGYSPSSWNFGDRADPDRKLLFEDEDAWLEKEGKRVWDEEQRKNAAA
jgi:hypothetical protein